VQQIKALALPPVDPILNDSIAVECGANVYDLQPSWPSIHARDCTEWLLAASDNKGFTRKSLQSRSATASLLINS